MSSQYFSGRVSTVVFDNTASAFYIFRMVLDQTDESGVEHKISKGQALFVPQGTRCSWQAKEKISLHFVQVKQ